MLSTLASITFLISSVTINNNERVYLIPSGENIVFKMNTNGVVVTGTYDVKHDNGIYNPERNSDIKRGDIIISANNKKILNINDLSQEINNNNQIDIEYKRKNKIKKTSIYIYNVDNISRSGLYVKDKVIGVGTMTYIDPKNMMYGALGHEVIDNDTKELVELSNGTISYNDVLSIKKGENHHPGEKISQTNLENIDGNILINSNKGMFGKINKANKSKGYPIAYQNEIKEGKAKILTCIKGNDVKEYDIEITSLKKQNIDQTKGITFKITDNELLNISGGVYSGMSGSPIIQNNMIIGAVTHVLVDNIEYGYGLYIENMYRKQIEF